MAFLEDELRIKIEDVDDVVRVWIKNTKHEFKHIESLEAVYKNGIHGFSEGKLSGELREGDNHLIIGSFNKVFNGAIKLKYLPFPLALKGGKISYALSFYVNDVEVWSHFKYFSDSDMIKDKNNKFKISNYFGCRNKEEEDKIVGLKYYHVFKIHVDKKQKIKIVEVYYKDFISNSDFHFKTFDIDIKEDICNRLLLVNKEFIENEETRYADKVNSNNKKGR